jgi:hypothetical protein
MIGSSYQKVDGMLACLGSLDWACQSSLLLSLPMSPLVLFVI